MRPNFAGADALQLRAAVRPLKEDVVGDVGQVLWVLLGSISILLLIACANVANLLLVRAEARGTELALRTTLGAGPGRLARGLMTESLTLSVIGGLIGVGLAYGGLRALLAFPPANLPRLSEITIDLPVLGFALGVSVLAGLLFGLVPILRVARQRLANVGGRWASAGKSQHRAQNVLVVAQVALALVMLVSSGLMIRTFQNLRSVEPGFTDPATVQTVRLSMQGTGATGIVGLMRMSEQMLERLAAIPGVTSAAYTGALPMQGAGSFMTVAEGETYESEELPPTRRIEWISPGLLQTLGTPLLAGRDFDWTEVREQRNVALVSASFARESWNSVEGAVGKRIDVGNDGSWQEVIGVVADVFNDGVDRPAPPTVYWPAREQQLMTGLGTYLPASVTFALRSERTGTESMLADIRRAVAEVAPDLPIAAGRHAGAGLSRPPLDGAKLVFAGAARNRRCDGAPAQHRRHLWRARLCRHAAPARGWNPRRAGRRAAYREKNVRLSRDDSIGHRNRRWGRGSGRRDAIDVVAVVWRHAPRRRHVRGRGGVLGGGGAFRKLYPRPPRGDDRSDGNAQGGVASPSRCVNDRSWQGRPSGNQTPRVRGKGPSAPSPRPSVAICRRRSGPCATAPNRYAA